MDMDKRVGFEKDTQTVRRTVPAALETKPECVRNSHKNKIPLKISVG